MSEELAQPTQPAVTATSPETENPAATPSQLVAQTAAAPAELPSAHAAPATASDPARFVHEKLIEGKVIEALCEIYDPEIPVNIYELGLIYEIKVGHDDRVDVKMTLTAPACPVAGSLPGQVESRINSIPEVSSATVELVWEPPWTKDRMSEAAQLQLGF